jgi:serine/threonine-protein kinase
MHDASHPSHPSYPGPGQRLPALPAPPQESRRPVRRKGPLIGAAAILLSLAVAAFLVFDSGDKGATWKTFPGNVAAPFSFAYPGDWPSRAHADEYVVFSPSARQFEALFSVPVSSDWSVVNPILSGDTPEQASGLLVEEADTIDASDTEQVKTGLSALLPGPVAIPAEPSATSVGGRPAFRVTGTISDPGQNGTLEFTAYVVRRDDKPTALLTFFCAPSRCDKNAMDHVVSSVAFG